jgi:uncharacterized protein
LSLPEEISATCCRTRHVIYSLAAYIAFIIVFFYVETGVLGPEALEAKGPEPATLLLEDVVGGVILSAIPLFIVAQLYQVPLAAVGFTSKAWRRNLVVGAGIGVLLWLLASLADSAITQIVGPAAPHPSMVVWRQSLPWWMRALWLFSVSVLTPFSEELYFRGFVFTVVCRLHGRWAGILASSVFFAALHFQLASAIPIFGMGVILALLFERTKSLVPVTVAHAVVNTLSLL